MMNGSKVVLGLTSRFKPLLLKIFPYELLKAMKGKMIQRSFQKIKRIQREPFRRERYADGINLIGNIKADTGLGQSCRLVAGELECCRLPFSVYQYDQLGVMSNTDSQYDGMISRELPYNINLIHINPHELGLAFLQLDSNIWNGRYNIGFWLWELEEFPDEWTPCFHCLDEIWTPSEFTSNSIRKKTDLPVVTVPYHLKMQGGGGYVRSDFQLPDHQFLFLMMYDRTSMTERKNPTAVLDAYRQAFGPGDEVGLVIKINNSTEEEMEAIRSRMRGASNLYFITEVLSREQVNSLIACVDVVISLHRAEGFGLVLAEAMMLGTPVIATNWSSNTEFMTADTACLVDAKLITLEKDYGSFKKGNRWADPDVGQASAYMRRLYEDNGYYEEIARKAKEHIADCLGMEQAAAIMDERIGKIYGETER